MAINKEAAITKFLEINFSFLTSEEVNPKNLKTVCRKYFYDQHNKKFGIPGKKEIGEALVKLLLKRGTSQNDIENLINDLPIFNLGGDETKKAYNQLLKKPIFKSCIDLNTLSDLKNVGSYEALKKHEVAAVQVVKQEELDKLEELIENKKKEYEDLPSVLEATDIPIPTFDPKIEVKKEWWQRLHLRADPFPSTDGLTKLDESLYEDVVIKTKPFEDILSRLDGNPEHLFNTAFLLTGGYGFGKTTFMEYLAYYLIKKNVMPIHIMNPNFYPDARSYIDDFQSRLKNKLMEKVRDVYGDTNLYQSIVPAGVDEDIIVLCKRLLEKREGIVVMLDDYHKHQQENQEAIFNFLSGLQITKNVLIREGIKIGFIVSGLPEWKNKLTTTHTHMKGFLDSPSVEMPEITPQIIFDVFNKRIKAFSYSPNPHFIKLNFIEMIFHRDGTFLDYRSYLDKIHQELSNNNSAVLNTPMEIEPRELEDIRKIIESYQTVKTAFNTLVKTSRIKGYTVPVISSHLEMLVQVSLHDGIEENNPLFNENLPYFKKLKDLGLIQKQHLIDDAARFKWRITTKLQKAMDTIRQRYGKEINDYLLKIYSFTSYEESAQKDLTENYSEIKKLASFFEQDEIDISESAKENLRLAFRSFFRVITSDISGQLRDDKQQELIKHAVCSFEFLSKAFFDVDGSINHFHNAGISVTEMQWRYHWTSDEGISEFYNYLNKYHNGDEEKITFQHIMQGIIKTFPLLAGSLQKIVNDICGPNKGPIRFRNQIFHYTEQEVGIFDSAQGEIFSSSGEVYLKLMKRFSGYLEGRFRLFFYSVGVLSFGEREYFELVPDKDAKKYAHRNLDHQEYSILNNLFLGTTRRNVSMTLRH